jgi:hypothetical protein
VNGIVIFGVIVCVGWVAETSEVCVELHEVNSISDTMMIAISVYRRKFL